MKWRNQIYFSKLFYSPSFLGWNIFNLTLNDLLGLLIAPFRAGKRVLDLSFVLLHDIRWAQGDKQGTTNPKD